MTYKIVFSGKIEDEYVNDSEGIFLAEMFKSRGFPERVEINGNVYEAKSIKAVISGASNPDDAERKNRGMEIIEESNVDFKKFRGESLKKTPKERAQSIAMMNMICQALRGRPLTEEEKVDVRAAQEKWFTEHPDFHTANPTCYFSKEDMARAKATIRERPGEATQIKDLLARNILNLMERHLNSA